MILKKTAGPLSSPRSLGPAIQWRSHGLSGWATCPPGGPKWGRKWALKVWGEIRKINRDLRKNEESGTFARLGLWGWLRPWPASLDLAIPAWYLVKDNGQASPWYHTKPEPSGHGGCLDCLKRKTQTKKQKEKAERKKKRRRKTNKENQARQFWIWAQGPTHLRLDM